MTEQLQEMNRIKREAQDWLAYLYSGETNADGLARFESWLAADARQAAEYQRAEQLWRDMTPAAELAGLESALEPTLWERAYAGLGAVRDGLSSLFARPVIPATVAVAALLLVGIAWFGPSLYPGSTTSAEHHSTQVAEVRKITLPDTSVVTLGARSSIDTVFTAETRTVKLISGEAFFSVTSDSERPFVVGAGATRVRVVGTQFNVHRGEQRVTVGVLEGMVDVMSAKASERLSAGQEAVATSRGDIETVRNIKFGKPGAWRDGRLLYANADLAEVVADANRYYHSKIVFGSPALRNIKVSTAFRVDQVDQMIESLVATHPIVAERSDGQIVLRLVAEK